MEVSANGEKKKLRPFRNNFLLGSMSEVSIFFNGELLLSTEPTFEHAVKVNGSMVKHPLRLVVKQKKQGAKRQHLCEEKEEGTSTAKHTV